jgi:hypothetical protein
MGGNSGRITVRERIDPEITATLFANYRSSADALLELIDSIRRTTTLIAAIFYPSTVVLHQI